MENLHLILIFLEEKSKNLSNLIVLSYETKDRCLHLKELKEVAISEEIKLKVRN